MENNSAKQKPIVKNSIIAYALAAFLSLLLSPFAGRLYSWLFGVYCSTGFFILPGDKYCSYEGFLICYSLFIILILTLFFKEKIKTILYLWLMGTSFILLILLLAGDWQFLSIIMISSLLTYVLCKIVLKAKNK